MMFVSPMPQISVRFATLLDIPRVTEIYTSALSEDEVFDYICRYRNSYHDEHVFYYSQKLKGLLFDTHTAVMVAESQQQRLAVDDQSSKEIVAFAIWSLKGISFQRNVTWQDSVLWSLMRKMPLSTTIGLRHLHILSYRSSLYIGEMDHLSSLRTQT